MNKLLFWLGVLTMQAVSSASSYEITNETQSFGIRFIQSDHNGWMTVQWESVTTHVYEVQSKTNLVRDPTWTVLATMAGDDDVSSWTDTNAPSYFQRFYLVRRQLSTEDADGDGMPNGWELGNGLNPLDANDALLDTDGDGFSNGEEYRAGTDPRDANSHPSGILTIPNSWAVYANSNMVEIVADIRSTNQFVKVKAAEYFMDSTNGVVNGTGNAMSATNGAFNSTSIIAKATFPPSFPYGERHEIFVHAQGQDRQWCPFVKVVINPNVNDILDKVQANYAAFQDIQFNVITIETHNNAVIVTNSAVVKMKGAYKLRMEYDTGFVGIQNDNKYWYYNSTLGIGGALVSGINDDFSAQASRVSDFFWDVPSSQARTDTSITNSTNLAVFDLSLVAKTGVLWPTQGCRTDYTKGIVTQLTGQAEDVSVKSEYLNPIEIIPGHWLFTFHRHLLIFDSGDQVIVESTLSGVQVNQGMPDSLFNIPTE